MYVSEISLAGIRSFDSRQLRLSHRINVFVGANNCGKSTLLRTVLGLQYNPPFDLGVDSRHGYAAGAPSFRLTLNGQLPPQFQALTAPLFMDWKSNAFQGSTPTNGVVGVGTPVFNPTSPQNAIYPYLSRRKAVAYSESVRVNESSTITTDFQFLNAKLDLVTNSERPVFHPFMQACEDILGFRVSTAPSDNGKRGVYIIDDFRAIPLAAMGEGVTNILGLLVDLFLAEKKIFVIEEIENDIHPGALKKLLRLIASDKRENQFLVSTHSNIVVRVLCAETTSKLFNVSMRFVDRIPTSSVDEVPGEAGARRAVLEDLGYEFADFDLHAAWLFLEESSAEQIIRDYLVPWFAPKLAGRLRTFAAGGINNVEVKFNDFDRLFVFLNLESTYKNRAWVIVDSGQAEAKVIESLRTKWTPKGWASDNFQQFSEHDFERYFPERFKYDIDAACAETMDKQAKRERKSALLKQVVAWVDDDATNAKIEFQTSAGDVIERLQKIESVMT